MADEQIQSGMGVAYQLLNRLASPDSGWRLCAPADDGWKGWSIQHGEGEGAHAIVIRVEQSTATGAGPGMLCFTAELYSLLGGEWILHRVLWDTHRRPEKGEQENIIAAALEAPIRRAMADYN
jgi:hypothetical protein